MEKRFYLLTITTNLDDINKLTDSEYQDLSERYGLFYSSKGFTLAFNLKKIDLSSYYLRIIDVPI